MRALLLTLALLLFVVVPYPVAAHERDDHPGHAVKVMTRNLYLGADLTPAIVAPDVPTLIGAVTTIFATVEATNFPERARRLAREIAKLRPDLVGLQEVALWRSQIPTNGVEEKVEFDFLALLLDALEARGQSYEVVAVQVGTDVVAPALTPEGFCCRLIRFTDREVILARRHRHSPHLGISNPQAAAFAVNLVLPLPGGGVFAVQRGWASVDVKVEGSKFRFISTHLEVASALVQVLQGQELLAGPANTPLPVVLVCDCNSAADGLDTATYGILIEAGFDDAWSLVHPGDPGPTCCHAEDLSNPLPTLVTRIDLVLFRGGFDALKAVIVGEELRDRTRSGLWPSDHAGVEAKLSLPRRHGRH